MAALSDQRRIEDQLKRPRPQDDDPAPLDSERIQGLAGFRFALRRFLAASETISRGAGVTQQQYQALLAIRACLKPAMSIKDLAEQLLLTHHAAVQLVDRLAAAGLAERTQSETDRRKVVIALTEAGASLIERLTALHLAEILRQERLLSRSLDQLRRIGAKS